MADSMVAQQIVNGSFGEVWIDSEKVAECYALNAKVTFNKESVKIAGQLAADSKLTGWEGKGTLKLHKVNSAMAQRLADFAAGRDVRFTIITKLNDPDSEGIERVALKNVSFDDLTLADWEAGVPGKVEHPFTFTNYEYLDQI